MAGERAATGEQLARVRQLARDHDLVAVRVGGVDIDGIWRGKRIGIEEFLEHTAEHGTGLCNGLFAITMADEIINDLSYTGFDRGFPEVHLVPDLGTFALTPWAGRTAAVIGDFVEADGTPTGVSPRQVLRSVVARARELGYVARIGYELEFFLFRDRPETAAPKGFSGLEPLYGDLRTYNLSRLAQLEPLIGGIIADLATAGVPVEAAHTEYCPGQFELNLPAADPMTVADRAVAYKHAVRELAASKGLSATFMAKYDAALAGSSGHIHQSLWNEQGEALFAAPAGGNGVLSVLGRRYVAGLLATMVDVTALLCPTVNSYKRMVPWTFAPTNVSWDVDNRTCAVRALPGAGGAARVEHRLPGADANPYLAIAACLAGGLYGIERELDPPDPAAANAYGLGPEAAAALPATLDEAVTSLDGSKLARRLLGEPFVDHFVATRRAEVAAARAAVTDWERRRYFELV
jgi:glutamine synthetase